MDVFPVVELKNINKKYPGVQALKDVNIQLHAQEIHCLVGENGSGKSTLIKILSGVETPEPNGEIYIDNKLCTHHTCESALHNGIQVIYQDISLFPNLSVKENIAFRNYVEHNQSFVDWKHIEDVAHKALQEIGVTIDLNEPVGQLSIAQQQLVEIARSLTGKLRLLILDEPTASLTRKEVNALFDAIARIKTRNISVLFVSHKLNEVFEIAEHVTVLRDGALVGKYNPSELDNTTLVHLMTGETEINKRPTPISTSSPYLLEVQQLSKKNNYKDINLHLSKGEILGITGLLGSGRTELALSLFGMNRPDSGKILIDGKIVNITTQVVAQKNGIAYVPENRRDDGLIQEQNVQDNIVLTTLKNYFNKFLLLDHSKIEHTITQCVKDLDIKVSSFDVLSKTLSGGNQQKVVLAKWLAANPKILILDEPTVGIDVIAKSNIHQIMKDMAQQGMGIIMISDELQEVMNNCHRILVMSNGKIAYEFLPEHEDPLRLEQFNLA